MNFPTTEKQLIILITINFTQLVKQLQNLYSISIKKLQILPMQAPKHLQNQIIGTIKIAYKQLLILIKQYSKQL